MPRKKYYDDDFDDDDYEDDEEYDDDDDDFDDDGYYGWRYYRPAQPIRVEGGLKTKSGRGEIGSTWWSKRWIGVLESFSMGTRLTRGRSYARQGQTKHNAAWTSHPDGRFHLRIAADARAARYRFGTKTADFHVCLTCGVIPIVTCAIEGIRYAVFNVNTFDDVERSQLAATAVSFEGETTENRLARRRRNWTPEAAS
jgi:hypothetical protein